MSTETERKKSQKKQRFVDEYLVDMNATQAAIRAGYSKKTAYSQGQRLLKNVEIKNLIDSKLEERQRESQITADRVMKELAAIAFYPLAKIQPKASPVRVSDKVRALDTLGKYMQLETSGWRDESERVSGIDRLPEIIAHFKATGRL